MRYLIVTYICLFAMKAVARQATSTTQQATGPGETGIAAIDNAQNFANQQGNRVQSVTTRSAPEGSEPANGSTGSTSGRYATTSTTGTSTGTGSGSGGDAYSASLRKIDEDYQKLLAKVDSGQPTTSGGTGSGSTTTAASSSSSAVAKDELGMKIDACIAACKHSSGGVALAQVNCFANCPRWAAGLSDAVPPGLESTFGFASQTSGSSDSNMGMLLQMLANDGGTGEGEPTFGVTP